MRSGPEAGDIPRNRERAVTLVRHSAWTRFYEKDISSAVSVQDRKLEENREALRRYIFSIEETAFHLQPEK